MRFSKESIERLQSLMDEAVSGPDAIPGATVVVVDKNGDDLFVHSAGKRGATSKEDMTPQNVFWMASCTKMLTALACMQLVERGILDLDDSEQLEDLCPELQTLSVLAKDGSLEPKRNGITLRMLLTHTAGFGYSFFNTSLRDWARPVGMDEFSGEFEDMIQPLVFQPGEGWEYGISMDWAGIALERMTGTKLNDYIHAHVCQPLGLKSMTMFPTPEMKQNLAYMHQRTQEGVYSVRDHLFRRPLVVRTKEQRDAVFHSGGGGMFAKPQDFSLVLAVLLNEGTCPITGAKLLEKTTVNEMFQNSIPDFPQFGRQGIPNAKPDLTNPLPDLYPTEGNSPQGWGLSFMLTGGATGRSAGTGWWAGLANLFWWADRENGVAGVVCTQVLPFADPKILALWFGVEAGVYQALQDAR